MRAAREGRLLRCRARWALPGARAAATVAPARSVHGLWADAAAYVCPASGRTSINHSPTIIFRVDGTLMPRDSRRAIAVARPTLAQVGGGTRAASRASEGTGKHTDEPWGALAWTLANWLHTIWTMGRAAPS